METTQKHITLHFPFGLLALAIAALFASQIGANQQSTKLMKWQIETAQKNIEDMRKVEKQNAEAITNREATVKQSGELQGQLQALLTDLIELAKEDPQADQIIKKWNVQRNVNAPAPGATPAESKDEPAL